MAFVNMHIFSQIFLHFGMSLLLLTVTLRGEGGGGLGGSNKLCLLSLFSFPLIFIWINDSLLGIERLERGVFNFISEFHIIWII